MNKICDTHVKNESKVGFHEKGVEKISTILSFTISQFFWPNVDVKSSPVDKHIINHSVLFDQYLAE